MDRTSFIRIALVTKSAALGGCFSDAPPSSSGPDGGNDETSASTSANDDDGDGTSMSAGTVGSADGNGSDAGCAVGSEGCECTAGGSCDDGFSCLSGVCVVVCGDGSVGPGEQCDDGNDVDDDACSSTCMLTACGDGMLDAAREECDLGDANGPNAPCRSDCTLATCGDGEVCDEASCTVGPTGGPEECDDGEDNGPQGACLPDCAAATCGDGFVHTGAEECDGSVPMGTTCGSLGYESGTAGCRPPGDPDQCQVYGCCNYMGGACETHDDCCGYPTYVCDSVCVHV